MKQNFKIVNVTLDKATIQRAKALAIDRASTVSALVRDLVRAEWQQQNDGVNKTIATV
jgi:post-segregation antitoxin (ccd killing protein)